MFYRNINDYKLQWCDESDTFGMIDNENYANRIIWNWTRKRIC